MQVNSIFHFFFLEGEIKIYAGFEIFEANWAALIGFDPRRLSEFVFQLAARVAGLSSLVRRLHQALYILMNSSTLILQIGHSFRVLLHLMHVVLCLQGRKMASLSFSQQIMHAFSSMCFVTFYWFFLQT